MRTEPLPLILAVDDEHSGLYRKLILEHAGYTVLSATGVAEALHLFHGNPVDLVLTDQLLGRQVGTEMAEMAREMKRTKPCVPVSCYQAQRTSRSLWSMWMLFSARMKGQNSYWG